MVSVSRFDRQKLSKVAKTGAGGLRVDAALTRTGIFEYQNPDGTTRKEFRPADEVFNANALASFAGLPVTIGHPGTVTAENWKTHAIGHVGDTPRQDGDFVAAPLFIQDAKGVAGIEAGEYVEVSCGYQVDLDETPGVTEAGDRYDCIQRNIRGNHLAIGPRGWGRGGKDVAMRLDSHGDQLDVTEKPAARKIVNILLPEHLKKYLY